MDRKRDLNMDRKGNSVFFKDPIHLWSNNDLHIVQAGDQPVKETLED